MDRATKAVRRSGVKLMSLGADRPHTDLNLLLMELSDVQRTAKAFMKVQNSMGGAQSKWGLMESSPAIRDVTSQLEELTQLWSQMQHNFVESVRQVRGSYELILDCEKRVDHAQHAVTSLEQREARLRKEVKRAAEKRRCNAEEIRSLEIKLFEVENQRHNAQMELTDKSLHSENLKVTHLKRGLLDMSDAFLALAANMSVVFEAHKSIASQLPTPNMDGNSSYTAPPANPDTKPHVDDAPKYTGRGTTKQIVEMTRTRLENYQCVLATTNNNKALNPTTDRRAISVANLPPPINANNITAEATIGAIDSLILGKLPEQCRQLAVTGGSTPHADRSATHRSRSPPPPYTPNIPTANADTLSAERLHQTRRLRSRISLPTAEVPSFRERETDVEWYGCDGCGDCDWCDIQLERARAHASSSLRGLSTSNGIPQGFRRTRSEVQRVDSDDDSLNEYGAHSRIV